MNTQTKTRAQWSILTLGLLGTVCCFLHVLIGSANYPGYNPVTQAVSDLTAANAPSREIASVFTQINSISTVALCILLSIYYRGKISKTFRLGINLLMLMQTVSAAGYTLFPLSGSGTGTFQDTMHMVVTVLVVGLSIMSMTLIAIGCFQQRTYRTLGVITLVALVLMFAGSIGVNARPEYFGIAERLSVYSVVLYSAVLALFAFFTRLREVCID